MLLWRHNAREEAIRRALENAVAERTRELSHQYRHDVLTGFPNRLLFARAAAPSCSPPGATGTSRSPFCSSISTASSGSTIPGDIRPAIFSCSQISERLRCGPASATKPSRRIGGDEFIVLIPGAGEKAEAEKRGWDLLRTLEAPIHIEGKNVFATMSVGISASRKTRSKPGTLMAAADAAMYRAKAAGKNQVQLFEAGMTEAASRPQNIEDRLREALQERRFPPALPAAVHARRQAAGIRSTAAYRGDGTEIRSGRVHSDCRGKRSDCRRWAPGCCAKPAAR